MLFEIVLFTVLVITLLLSFPDPPNGEEWQALDDGLAYGTDMVRHIRQEFGDCFTVCVAGKDRINFFFINHAVCRSRKYPCVPQRRNSVKTPPALPPTLKILMKPHTFQSIHFLFLQGSPPSSLRKFQSLLW